MARLDHFAYRVADRDVTVKFLIDAFQYKFQSEFEIFFNNEKTDRALCVVLEPPEKNNSRLPFHHHYIGFEGSGDYHMAPEICSTWTMSLIFC